MRYCFAQDDDCHWYLLKLEDAKDFTDWVYDSDNYEGDGFDDCRIDSAEFYSFENPIDER